MNSTPRISVLLPVYNARPFLRDALESMAVQTFRDFEAIAVDDGSTDGSAEVLTEAAKKWPWLRIIRQANGGISKALNHGLTECRGEFVARMDADDIALPNRFARQLGVLETHPNVGMVGSAVRTFGSQGRVVWRYPIASEAIRARIFFASPFAHPTVMFRRQDLAFRMPLYREDMAVAQDYELWSEIIWRTEVVNLPDVLLDYRYHSLQISATKMEAMLEEGQLIWQQLFAKLGLPHSGSSVDTHALLAGRSGVETRAQLRAVAAWMDQLWAANQAQHCIMPDEWAAELRRHWYAVCRNASPRCKGVFGIYWRSPWRYERCLGSGLTRTLKFWLRRTWRESGRIATPKQPRP